MGDMRIDRNFEESGRGIVGSASSARGGCRRVCEKDITDPSETTKWLAIAKDHTNERV